MEGKKRKRRGPYGINKLQAMDSFEEKIDVDNIRVDTEVLDDIRVENEILDDIRMNDDVNLSDTENNAFSENNFAARETMSSASEENVSTDDNNIQDVFYDTEFERQQHSDKQNGKDELDFSELREYLLDKDRHNIDENLDPLSDSEVDNEAESLSDLSDVSDLDEGTHFEETDTGENIETDPDTEPLYNGANITIGAFMLLLAVYFSKHNITGDGIQQLLNIIALALPHDHLLCTSLHAYKMFFRNLKNPMVYHYYCKHCLGLITDDSSNTCTNEHCGKPFNKKDKTYFLEIPVVTQLRNLFLQNGFYESLQHRFHRNVVQGAYEDIYDGKLYKSYFENNGPLTSPSNISFTFNTDGAAVFKSSNFSIWPIYLVINELPYICRMKKENMILASLWFGSQKPLMSTYLKPFLTTLQKLYEGFECFASGVGNFLCRGFLLCGTADLPARSLLCNCNQYNGAYSCWKCSQEGRTAKVGKGHTRVFPYNDQNPKGPERTKTSLIADAEAIIRAKTQGTRNVTAINGIKGPSWLILAPMFNIIHGIAIDYMHGVLLGVQKLLLRLWFGKEFSGKQFNYSNRVSTVDDRLNKIKPTLAISRMPRTIENELKYWKASEFRSFLLFYGATVMCGILDVARFEHYLLLVNSMYILLKCGSTDRDIDRAEKMLFSFCENFANLYDVSFMTLNMHQLVHLPDSVRYLGPLYTHSCFSFEDNNGFMLKMIRGTQCIDNQITTGISFIQKLPELKQKCLKVNSEEEKLYNAVQFPHILKRGMKIGEGIYILGSVKERVLNQDEFTALSSFLRNIPTTDQFNTFVRLEMKSDLIYGRSYKRMSKRDNSVIKYEKDGEIRFGCVRYFLRLSEDDIQKILAIAEVLECPNYDERSNILAIHVCSEIDIVPIENILSSVMLTIFDKASKSGFVCLFPNHLESD